MNKTPKNEKGFGAIGIILIVVVLAAIVGAGTYVYHKDHKAKVVAVSSTKSSSSKASTKTKVSTSKAQLNPYAGWKTYCDSTYHYCFKYPNGWQITAGSTVQLGSTSQTLLTDGAKTVTVSYVNAFIHDSGPIAFTPTYVSALSSANQNITLVGGYSPASGLVGNYLPTYKDIDSSFLTTYPLTIGQSTQFPNNPGFTDNDTGNSSYQGELIALPSNSINTVSDAQAWLSSTDAKTCIQILQSLYYQQ